MNTTMVASAALNAFGGTPTTVSATTSAVAVAFTDASPPIPLNLTCYFLPSPSLASENQLLFSRYVNGYLTGVCVIGGTIGNVMSVRSVRLSNFERNRGIGLAVVIIVLAIWDTLMLWCAIAYYGLKNLIPTPANDWAILATPFFHGFSQVTHTASVWSVVTITVQRYMATRDPFRNTKCLLYIASAVLHEQNRAMFSSFRNGSCVPPNTMTSVTNATASNVLCAKASLTGASAASTGSGVSSIANSVKWHSSFISQPAAQHYPPVRNYFQSQSQIQPRNLHRAVPLAVSTSSTPAGATSPTSHTLPPVATPLYMKYSSDWKTPSSFWKYLVKYRRHFRTPFIISVLAILVNIPAFFEITAVSCYYFPEYRIIYKLYVSHFRLNDYYKFWYRMIFRMLVTTCGPNIFILCLTVITVLMLRGTNRSRQRLFHNNELAIEQYSSRAKMLTTISICLAVKFLLLRSLTFMLDIWEVAYGFKREVHRYLYAVDISNFLIILNSSTNCLIIYGFSRWLHHKISVRNIEKREKQQCLNSITKRRATLLHDSWLKALKLTHCQFGNRILYAMLLKNPQMFASFRDTTTPSCSDSSSRAYSLLQQNFYNNNDYELSDDGGSADDDENSVETTQRNGCVRQPTDVSLSSNPANATTTTSTSQQPQKQTIGNISCHTTEADQHNIVIHEYSHTVDDDAANTMETSKLLPSITITTPQQSNNVHRSAGANIPADEYSTTPHLKPINVEAAAAATLSAIPKKKKRSIDLLMSAKFYEFGEQILHFFDDLIQMIHQGSNEQAISAKIQLVGKIHHDHGVTFTASVWKEFKASALSIFSDCEYDNEADRSETLEAWSSFLSIIIHNMKLGMWNGNRYSIHATSKSLAGATMSISNSNSGYCIPHNSAMGNNNGKCLYDCSSKKRLSTPAQTNFR